MAKQYVDPIASLKSLLPSSELELLGRAVRFIKRLRCIEPGAFVWATVLSRLAGGRPGFAEAGSSYRQLRGAVPYPKPFQVRFKTPAAVRLFEGAFSRASVHWREPRPHPLRRYFNDIIAVDSTFVRLSDALAGVFPGIRNLPAAMKVVLGVSVFGRVPLFARLVAGTANDVRFTPNGALLRRTRPLWLFDKGFVKYGTLRKLARAGHYFLCPMRRDGRALIVGVHDAPARVRKALRRQPRGIALRDLLAVGRGIRRAWDLRVRLEPKQGPDYSAVDLRLVIVPGPGGEQRPYLTNLAPVPWRPQLIRELYRLRWQVELVFKELKQDLNLETVPTKDPHAARCFVWASLIALAVTRVAAGLLQPLALTAGLAAKLRPAVLTRALRGATALLAHALANTRSPAATLWPRVLAAIAATASTRDRHRDDSLARVLRALPARA